MKSQVTYVVLLVLFCVTSSSSIEVSSISSLPDCENDLCLFYNPLFPPSLRFCIQREMLCNGKIECEHAQDEENCEDHVCERFWFKCDNICKPDILICDGVEDCGDGTDEKDCETYECVQDWFKCKTDFICVNNNKVCDGISDCNDSSDEIGCFECENFAKHCGEFDSPCIKSLKYCDGTEDCKNGEDEKYCEEICELTEQLTSNVAPGSKCEKKYEDSHPLEYICDFGLDGQYCNETCTRCDKPFCIEHLNGKKNKHYRKIVGYTDDSNPPCVSNDVIHLEIKDTLLPRLHSGILKNISSQLELLRMSNVSHECMDTDFLTSTRSNLRFLYMNFMNLSKDVLPNIQKFDDLSILNLDHNNLREIAGEAFKDSISILTISITNNKLSKIQPDLFRDQGNSLLELYLSFNLLSSEIHLRNLRRLRLLDISHNCIDHLSQNVFQDLEDLERIYLQGNALKTIGFPRGVSLDPLEFLLIFVDADFNCSSVEKRNEIECTNESSNVLKINDPVGECSDTCINSKCVELIGGFSCNDTRCNENECSIQRHGRCSTAIGGASTPVTGDCINPCKCNLDEKAVSCADSQGLDKLIRENKLCLPTPTETLKLMNISISDTAFYDLLSTFGNFSKVSLCDMPVEHLTLGTFSSSLVLSKVANLELRNNSLRTMPSLPSVFPYLATLIITQNSIKNITSMFLEMRNLIKLDLSHNEISHVAANAFTGLSSLTLLDLSFNKISLFHVEVFMPLVNLETLNVSDNSVAHYPGNLFQNQKKLQEVHGDIFTICCLVQSINPSSFICTPQDEISSCDRLIANEGLRALIWIQAFLTIFGNITAIILRIKEYKNVGQNIQQNTAKINILLIGTLAMSDFIMGAYLFIIVIADQIYAGNYHVHSFQWLASSGCAAAGVLALFSSETSVMMLLLITFTRLFSIVQPFNYLRMNAKVFYVSAFIICIFSLLLAFAPLIGFDSLSGYFSTSAVCLPSLYTSTSNADWIYTLFLVTLNFVSFILMAVAYSVLTHKARSNNKRSKELQMSSVANKKSNNNTGQKLNVRVAVLVLTDMLCWLPVCIVAVYSLLRGGLEEELHAVIYPVTAIIILPINAVINPIIYTLLTSSSISRSFKIVLGHLTSSEESNPQNSNNVQHRVKTPKKTDESLEKKPSAKIMHEAFAAFRISGISRNSANNPTESFNATCSTVISNENYKSEDEQVADIKV